MKYCLPLLSLFAFFSCKPPQKSKNGSTPFQGSTSNRYTGSSYKGNYVWGAAMNLCWTELCQSVLHEPLELKTDDAAALETTDRLNHPVCSTADLDEPAYYVKAGYGPATVAAINRECRAKFPDKQFEDLNIDLANEDIISYAYFVKSVVYENPFTKCNVTFDGQSVRGFKAEDAQKNTVEVLHYTSDEQFILRLRLKDASDEIILAKGYDTQEPNAVLQALADLPAQEPGKLAGEDYFSMPLLKLKFRRDYKEMLGKALKNKSFSGYSIGAMFENIAFELDETGAKVENEAVIMAPRGKAPEHGRYFLLNKPFWVIMKRSDSPRPYFLLGVNNAAVMTAK